MKPPTRPVDDVDRRLIALLERDGRASVKDVAAEANVSRANAYQRIQRLTELGVIRGYTVRTDPYALGLAIAALVIVNVEQHAWREVRSRFVELPGVRWVAATTGAFDYVLLVRVPDVETLRDVVLERLQSMSEVRSTQTVFVLDEVEV